MMNQISPPLGLRVGVPQGYICTKSEVNSYIHHKTCHHLLMAEPLTYFDPCDLEK